MIAEVHASTPLQRWAFITLLLAGCAGLGPSERAGRSPLPVQIGPLIHACPDTTPDDERDCQPVMVIAPVTADSADTVQAR
jgi:hypothetical protein